MLEEVLTNRTQSHTEGARRTGQAPTPQAQPPAALRGLVWSPYVEYVDIYSISGLRPMLPQRTLHGPDFDDEEIGSTALTAFFNITAAWGLSAEEERVLLGAPARSTFFKWKSERAAKLSPDTLERISYVMGIYKALRILLPTQEAAHAWIKKPNTARGFGGTSALERMLAGRVIDLADVRRYLDAQRG